MACSETPVYSFTTQNDNFEIGPADTYYYRGGYAAAAFTNVCRVDVMLVKRGTDISGYTFYCDVFNPDGDKIDLPAIATSTGVTGNNSWSESWVEFYFPTPVNISIGDIITISMHELSDWGNYAEWYVDTNGGGTDVINFGKWYSFGSRDDLWVGYDPTIKIYQTIPEWQRNINTVTSYSKINDVLVADIVKVNEIEKS